MSRGAVLRNDHGDEQRIDAAHLERLLDVIARAAPFKLPLFQAVADGIVNLCEPLRGAPFPHASLAKSKRPIVALIGDDDHASTGPAGFQSAKHFACWARAAIIHAAKGEAFHYEIAVDAALIRQHILMIETDTEHADQWRHLLGNGRIPVLMITPHDGPHPLPRVVQ